MGKHRPSHSRPQKVDHGGRFFQLPRDITTSVAYRSLSLRARCALVELINNFNGFNNGRIGLSIDNLSAALGNQNHAASSRAIGELMDRGFVECTATANHVKSKAREYRLTFVATGDAAREQATNEWRNWLPTSAEPVLPKSGNLEKIGPEATATREWKPVEATATRRKFSVEATATRETETRRVGGRFHVEATAAHISPRCQPVETFDPDAGNSFGSVDELRAALNAYLTTGAASATDVCKAIDMPAGTMSKFRGGRSLPEVYRGPLHWELGRRGAFSGDIDRNVLGQGASSFTGQSASPVKDVAPRLPVTPDKWAPPKKSALAWLSSPGDIMPLEDILLHGAEAFANAGGPCWMTGPRHAA